MGIKKKTNTMLLYYVNKQNTNEFANQLYDQIIKMDKY